MLDSRKGAVLRAIVREYVRAGQPVGSKALTKSYGLSVSAATVRNDMALLEDLGYIERPHASAGGVPTDKGYRWFVDNWPGSAWPELPRGQQLAIRGALQGGFHALEEALTITSQVLSQVTEAVAVVAAPPSRGNRLRRLELLPRVDGRVGVLLIADTGLVEHGLVELPGLTTERQLDELAASINAELGGSIFEDLPGLLTAVPEPDGARSLLAAEIRRMVGASTWERIYRGGTANILTREKFSDLETAYGVIGVLEQPMVLAALLGEAAQPPSGRSALLVLIGREHPIEQMQACATVLASYGLGSDRRGTLAVIGPTRMDYPHTISAVNLVAASLSGLLDELAS
jgi:heat-inducible transcriptional repressor